VSTDCLIVRQAASADAEAVLEMARALAAAVDDPPPQTDPTQFVRDGFGAERWFECLVAELDGRLVGYAVVCRGYEAHTGQRRLWLGDLYVTPGLRRSGAGRALMRTVARRAIELGCAAVYWELWHENSIGRAFYEDLQADAVGDLTIFRLSTRHMHALANE
jgi:GNAT superfamily N-acetyltransferase